MKLFFAGVIVVVIFSTSPGDVEGFKLAPEDDVGLRVPEEVAGRLVPRTIESMRNTTGQYFSSWSNLRKACSTTVKTHSDELSFLCAAVADSSVANLINNLRS